MDSDMYKRQSLYMQFTVTVSHDEVEGVWYVQSSDVPGLNAEAATLEILIDIIADLAPELVAANSVSIGNEKAGPPTIS